mgnify:CR=1 FL=1
MESEKTATEVKAPEPFIPYANNEGEDGYIETQPVPDGFFADSSDKVSPAS